MATAFTVMACTPDAKRQPEQQRDSATPGDRDTFVTPPAAVIDTAAAVSDTAATDTGGRVTCTGDLSLEIDLGRLPFVDPMEPLDVWDVSCVGGQCAGDFSYQLRESSTSAVEFTTCIVAPGRTSCQDVRDGSYDGFPHAEEGDPCTLSNILPNVYVGWWHQVCDLDQQPLELTITASEYESPYRSTTIVRMVTVALDHNYGDYPCGPITCE